MSSTSAPPPAHHQPQLLNPPSSPSLPLATPLSLLPLPSPLFVAFSSFTAVTTNPNTFLLRDVVARSSANFVTTAVSLSPPLHPCCHRRQAGPHGPHTSPSPSASSPSSSTRWSLLPNWPSQPSTSAPSFSSFSFLTPQRLSHRCLLSLFPDGLFSSVFPASMPSIIGRLLLLRRRSLLLPWLGSRRLPPLVRPSHANTSSVATFQYSINPVIADTRSLQELKIL